MSPTNQNPTRCFRSWASLTSRWNPRSRSARRSRFRRCLRMTSWRPSFATTPTGRPAFCARGSEMPAMKNQSDGIRKAAILIASIDAASAEALLRGMPSDQAQTVRQAAGQLADVDPAEQRKIIDEFFRVGPLVPHKQPCGLELTDQLADKLAVAAAPEEHEDRPTLLEVPIG